MKNAEDRFKVPSLPGKLVIALVLQLILKY